MAPPTAATQRQPHTRSGLSSWVILATFTGLLMIRSLNAVAIETFFQPDEYFQSLEPAWQLAFGADSGAWITWEWREQLRSAVHPVVMAAVYSIASRLSQWLDFSLVSRASFLVAAPKAFQVFVAAMIDLYSWKIAQIAYGPVTSESIAVLLLSVLNPWQWYCSTRTFSNTLETMLTAITLATLPWQWLLERDQSNRQANKDIDIDLRKILEGNIALDKSTKSAIARPPTTKPVESQSGKHRDGVTSLASSMGSLPTALTAAALACILRPTNAIIWTTLLVSALYSYGSYGKGLVLVRTALVVGLAVLAFSVLLDRAFYGVWTITQIRFLYFNIAQNISSFYGLNRPDYYFTEGLPLLLTTILPFAGYGFWQSIRPGPDRPGLAGYYERQVRYLLAVVIATTVLAFSMIAHKEVRFVYPLLPMLHVLAARPLTTFFKGFPLPEDITRLGLLILGIGINTYIQSYVGLIHQRGVISVMSYLRSQAEVGTTIKNITVGFLMPCHSTPWRSHLVHPQIKAWALTCEPPINLSLEQRQSYEDEADNFYAHPGGWLSINMVDRDTILRAKAYNATVSDPRLRAWPDYLVFFEQLEPTMNGVLDRTRYKECWRAFNTHWHDDWRRRGDVIVHCLDKS